MLEGKQLIIPQMCVASFTVTYAVSTQFLKCLRDKSNEIYIRDNKISLVFSKIISYEVLQYCAVKN